MHKLLARQLRLLELSSETLPKDLASWASLLDKISRVYLDNEQDRYLLERSIEISSREMQERWQALDFERAKATQSTKLATLGEMAGSIAHEINNPIGLISVIAAQVLEMQEEGDLDPEFLRDSLKKIEESAWRTAKIIKGLRGFSRDGSHDPFKSYTAKQMIDDVLIFCSEKFRQSDIKLKVQPIPDCSFECREIEICQILLNLLNNSSDAIQSSKDKWIEIAVTDLAEQVEFSITDCGAGISEKVLEKLFQPFFTTKELGKGTGLGLSISKKIAENHGGSLTYDRACPNTRFVLKVAKKQGSAKAPSAA